MLAEIQGDAVELQPWDSAGIGLMSKLQGVAASLTADRVQDLAIAVMDRYSRLSISGDGRVVLPPHLTHQLAPAGGEVVRIVVRGGRLWLWPETSWATGRSSRQRELDELMGLGA